MDLTVAYLSAEILTWAVPLALLIAVTIWWVVAFRRRSSNGG